jgi:cytosine deaminase
MNDMLNYKSMLETAIGQAKQGLLEGGIPIGAALFDEKGHLLGAGRNRRVQEDDPSVHAETDAFRKAGRQKDYSKTTMVTTLAPCWYCSGLIRQFGIGRVLVGESVNFEGGLKWLIEAGVEVVDMGSVECIEFLSTFIKANHDLWNEDIGLTENADD